MIDDDKIIQIIPAEGWSALFNKETESRPVACWALTHGGMVRGMIATNGPPHFAEQLEGFDRFSRAPESNRPAAQ